MSYINFINSANSPVVPFYKPIAEPTITAKDGNKTVEARIEWNNKSYLFRWNCDGSQSDDHIKTELTHRINTMLALGVRYGLGKKITALKYNYADDTVERTSKDPAKAAKSTKVDYDKKLHHYEDRLTKVKAEEASLPQEQRRLTKKYEDKQKIITWSKGMFEELKKSPQSQADRSSRKHHHHRRHHSPNPNAIPGESRIELIDHRSTSPEFLAAIKGKARKHHHREKASKDATVPVPEPEAKHSQGSQALPVVSTN